jgi:uncharacterized protein YrzB (UPF0473 family)
MEQNFEENPTITLIGEDGESVEFAHVLTMMYENERYMALTPAFADEDDEEAELVFMHIVKSGGEDVLEPVDNEVLLDELFDVFCELADEAEDEEDGEGGE